MQRRGFGRGGGYHDGVFHRAVLLERAHDLRHGRALLADRDIDAVEFLALVGARVQLLLVDEGVDRHRALAGLAVADDQLALTATDGNERVERLEAGLHGLVHRLARDDAGGFHFDAAALAAVERALAVDRIAERIDHAAEQSLAHGNVHDGSGALHAVAFGDFRVRTEDHRADIVGFQVERHALHAIGEFDHLAGLYLVETVDAGDAVTHRQHGAHFAHFGFIAEIGDLVLDDLGDFCGADIHVVCVLSVGRAPQAFMAWARVLRRVRIEASIRFEPKVTTKPPSRSGSVRVVSLTVRPSRAVSLPRSVSSC